uniref:Protein tweety homolog n=1 Tax=Syphacia muris TaxID=451379 RepID=A0A0N5B086_9BILA
MISGRCIVTVAATILLLDWNCYTVIAAETNETKEITLAKVGDDFGAQQAFYKIAQKIAKKIQRNLNDDDLDKLSEIWSDNELDYETVIDAVGGIMKKEVGLIIMLIIGAAYVVIMFFAGVIYCCLHCFKSGHSRIKYTNVCSSWTLPILTALLVVGVAFLVAAAIVYGVSVQDTDDNIAYIGDILPKIRDNLQSIIDESSKSLLSSTNSSLVNLFDSKLSKFKKAADPDELQKLITTISDTLDTVNIQNGSTIEKIEEVKTDLNAFRKGEQYEQINYELNKTQVAFDQVQDQMDSASKHLNGIVADVNTKISNVTDLLKTYQSDIASFSAREVIKHVLKAVIIAPAVLVAITVVILTLFAILRIFQNMCNLDWTTSVVKQSGKVTVFGIVVAFIFAWLFMLFSCFLLLIGFTIEATCEPVFYDEQMKLFDHIPHLHFTVTTPLSKNDTEISLSYVLKQCSTNSTISDALKFRQVLDVDIIVEKMSLEQYQQNIGNALDKIDFTNVNRLQTNMEALRTELEAVQQTEVLNSVNELIERLHLLQQLRGSFDNISVDLDNSLDEINNNTYQCRPLYDVWQNIGKLTCNRIGLPVQGMWASVGLIAVVFIPVIIVMIMVSGILHEKKKRHERRHYYDTERRQYLWSRKPNDSLSPNCAVSQLASNDGETSAHFLNRHHPQPAPRAQNRY